MMHGTAIGRDAAVITHGQRIDPVVVNIGIEKLRPVAALREAELITEERIIIQAGDDDDIEALAVEPAMKCEDAVVVACVIGVDVLAAQGRLVPSQSDEILCKAQLVAHGFVALA